MIGGRVTWRRAGRPVPGRSVLARGVLVAVAATAVAATSGRAQEPPVRDAVEFTQTTRAVVEVSDSATIDYLLFELFLAPLEAPERLQIIDVTRNGFGPDDVVVSYPSAEVFLIPEFVPEGVQELMGTWAPEAEYRMDSGNMPGEALAALVAAGSEVQRAESGIMLDLIQAVERSYRDLPVGVLFQRDSVGFTFQLWDYNRGAMQYHPRADVVSDTAVARVVSLLSEVGYVPGENVVGLGISLDARGGGVATAERALRGLGEVADVETRTLAARTVLLGTFDLDRSGSIDRAREIDAPGCAVWQALAGSIDGFPENLGLQDEESVYLAHLTLSIAPEVRAPATRRIGACLRGEEPVPTDPVEVEGAKRVASLAPSSVRSFIGLEVGARILRRGGAAAPGSADWAREVREALLAHYDADGSGVLDRAGEVDGVSCSAWRAIGATHPAMEADVLAGAGTWPFAEIGLAPSIASSAASSLRACAQNASVTRSIRMPTVKSRALALPPEEIREGVTTPLRGLARVPSEEQRHLPAKTILLAMFDLDRSGFIDASLELDAMTCDVWAALDEAFPDFARRYGFVRPEPSRPYRGHVTLNIDDALQRSAELRILACEAGGPPPPTAVTGEGPERRDALVIPSELADFLDVQNAAMIVRSSSGVASGSAAWAAAVRDLLVASYDFDRSGDLDSEDELDAVPCVVWAAVESTYGGPLDELGLAGSTRYLADRIGIAFEHGVFAGARISLCRG